LNFDIIMEFVRKKINSIFTKLLVVIIVTGLCIILALGAFFHYLYENVAETPMEKNIITNAVKYSGSSEAPVEVSLFRQAPHVVIEIRDHGAGIPDEDMPYIFEPFYRVEKSRSQTIKGYGLGLNLCKTIMEAHNGRIEIESSLGEGTTVTLYFPEQQEA